MKKQSKIAFNKVTFFLVGIIVLFLQLGLDCAAQSSTDANVNQNSIGEDVSLKPPMIIWSHNLWRSSIASLEHALSSDLIGYVAVYSRHRSEFNVKKNRKVQSVIKIVKNSGARLIWCRSLWPYYANKNIKKSDFFFTEYYVQEIKALRQEANEIKADFIALDTEPYGTSPMKFYAKGDYVLSSEDIRKLKLAVSQAVKQTGKVDFILPAGSLRRNHPYQYLAELGRFRIAENTYYANDRTIKSIKYPYEIFGAFLNPERKRKENPNSPYFLASDIFEMSHLWSQKKGVLLNMKKEKAMMVAKDLVDYANNLQLKSPPKSNDSNLP